MIIVQAPQTPRSQPFLLPVMSALLRIVSSSVMRGSMRSATRLPLTISSIGTSPGPTIATPPWACATAAPATPAASGATVAVFRNSRRPRLIDSGFSGSLFLAITTPQTERDIKTPEVYSSKLPADADTWPHQHPADLTKSEGCRMNRRHDGQP